MFVPYYILSETGVNDDHLGFADLDTNDIFSCVGRGLRMEDHHHTTALSFFLHATRHLAPSPSVQECLCNDDDLLCHFFVISSRLLHTHARSTRLRVV